MKRIFIDARKCNGCLACEVGCLVKHTVSRNVMLVASEWGNLKPRIHVEVGPGGRPVPIVCRHCENPPCVEACITGAMRKDPVTGLVTNEGPGPKCIGCWMCVMVCPYGAVVPSPDGTVAMKCDGCADLPVPACVSACPNGALIYADAEEHARTARKAIAFEVVNQPGPVTPGGPLTPGAPRSPEERWSA